jgi:hypothetical protein
VIDELEVLQQLWVSPLTSTSNAKMRAREDLEVAMARDEGHRPVVEINSCLVESTRQSIRLPSKLQSHTLRKVIAVAASVAAATVLASVLLIPTTVRPSSAATALQRIAVAASQQPSMVPGVGQDYFSEHEVSVKMAIDDVSGHVLAQATFLGTQSAWTSTNGSGEEAISWDSANFASAADQAAWNAIPGSSANLGPYSGVSEISGPSELSVHNIFDVSALTGTEGQLASEIEDGTTGIAAIDSISAGSATAFMRVATLLAGTDIGGSPQLNGILYGVLASLPGVLSLGPTTADSGASGVGFSVSDSGTPPATLIVDPSTGSLIELIYANNDGPAPGDAYVTGVGSPADTASVSTQWTEPTQTGIVDSSSMPSVLGHPLS